MIHKRFNSLTPDDMRITIPTLFTLARLALIPIIVGAMMTHYWGKAFALFLVAASTDAVDGWLARWMNERTFLGACLDAVTDKLLIVSCFATLAFISSPLFLIPLWFVVLVLVKESLLIFGAFWILWTKGSLHVQPTWLGKMTMFMQVLFIVWLFACYFFAWMPVRTYHIMLGLLLMLVFASLFHYAMIGYRYLRS